MECAVRNITVHFEEVGAGKPILMLHGSHSDHREMMHKMEPLFEQRQGWRRIYLDLPGRGKTPGAACQDTHDDILEVVLAFLDTVAPGTRFAVAGYSYGSYLAQGIVKCRSTQMIGVLLAVSPVRLGDLPSTKRHLPAHQVLVHDQDFAVALETEEQGLLEFTVVESLELLQAFRAEVKPGLSVADLEFINRIHARPTLSFDIHNLPQPFPAPALILAGRQDSICGYRESSDLLDRFPRGTLAVLDRAGHWLSVDQRALFQVLVSEWLDRMDEYSAAT